MNESADFSLGEDIGPTIRVEAGRTHAAADAGISALMRAGRHIYQRGAQLVRPAMIAARASDGTRIETPGILPVTPPMLQRELERAARWTRTARNGKQVRSKPPTDVVLQILAMAGEWPFDSLAATISTPTMRADGTLLTAEGYDEATGLMLLGAPPMPPIPAQPTRDDALAALALLLDLLREFPFTTDAARSVALSMLMTPVLRAACGDAVPMHLATAPEAGTGKSFLADVAAMLATGSRCPVMAYTGDAEELEKRLAGLVIEGPPIISIDNVNGTLTSSLLCQVIERPMLRIRPLGTSRNLLISNTVTIFANGNNLRVAGDLTRRTLVSELDADCEAPEGRSFTGTPLVEVARNRGRFIAAVLTIVRAYVCAGRPNRPTPLPSFEGWSDTVRGALIWCGRTDPLATNATVRADDPNREALAAVLAAWPTDQTAYTTAELLDRATARDATGEPRLPDFAEAVRAIATDRRGNLSGELLGNWLRDNKGRQSGGCKLVRGGTRTRPVWLCENRRARGAHGGCGGVSTPSCTHTVAEVLSGLEGEVPYNPLKPHAFEADAHVSELSARVAAADRTMSTSTQSSSLPVTRHRTRV